MLSMGEFCSFREVELLTGKLVLQLKIFRESKIAVCGIQK